MYISWINRGLVTDHIALLSEKNGLRNSLTRLIKVYFAFDINVRSYPYLRLCSELYGNPNKLIVLLMEKTLMMDLMI